MKIPELTFENLQTEMILFKNEILKDITELTKDLTEKYLKYDFLFKDEIKRMNELLTGAENKIKDLSNLLSIDKETKKKLESLLEFKKKTEEYIITNDIRYNYLEKDVGDNIYRHDNIFKDTVLYPGVIGPFCKFRNFHELIDYFINEILNLIKYKEKNEIDLSLYKSKLETMISGFKLQIDNFMKSSTQFTRKTVNQAEERINSLFLKYDDIINVNKIQFDQNLSNLDNKINEYKLLNEDLIKNLKEENDEIKNKMNKFQKEIQDKINDLNKKQNKNEYYNNNDYYNRRMNRINYKNNISKSGLKIIKSKSSSNTIEKEKEKEKEDKFNKKRKETKESKESKEKDNNEIKKTNNTNETNYSGIPTQINNGIKSLELKLQSFIKNEILNLSNKMNKSNKTIKDNELKEEKEERKISKEKSKEEVSKDSDTQQINKTDIEENKKKEFIQTSPKRKSHVVNNISKKVFETFMKKKEEKKYSKKYIFEKIKEVFFEDSKEIEDLEDDKIEKLKKRNTNLIIPKMPENIYITDIEKELIHKRHSNSTTILPFFSKIAKKKQTIKNKQPRFTVFETKPKIPSYKNIIKKPIKKQSIKQIQTSPQKDQKNLTQTKIDLDQKNKEKNEKKKSPVSSYTKRINYPYSVQPKKPDIKIETKEEIIKTPNVKRTQRLSTFALTLQGTKKLNVEETNDRFSKDNISSNINHLNNFNPTIYMNFPRSNFQFNERLLESLHPLYRSKKFSKYVRPYISALTNTYLTKLAHNEKKSMSQKKVRLVGNKSDSNLMKKKLLKFKNDKELKLPEIIDEEIAKNIKYSPEYKEKFQTLDNKDIKD